MLKVIKAGQKGVIATLVTSLSATKAGSAEATSEDLEQSVACFDQPPNSITGPVLNDLVAKVVAFGKKLTVQEARALLEETLQVLVHITKLDDGTDRIVELAEIVGLDRGKIVVSTVFALEIEGFANGYHQCRFRGSGLPPKFLMQLEEWRVPFRLLWLR